MEDEKEKNRRISLSDVSGGSGAVHTFVVLPFAVGVYTSFFKWDGFSDMKFNGLKNYLYVFQDDIYWKAIKNTFVYAILVTVLKNVIAFFLAPFLSKTFLVEHFSEQLSIYR